MQGSMSQQAQPAAILEWLQNEMGYRPLGPYGSSSKASMPTIDSIQKISRGNLINVWNFLLKRVKSEKTVEIIRRNIIVHGRRAGRTQEESGIGREGFGDSSSRETVLQERVLAEKEVEKLRQIVRRQRKELKTRMIEVSREEAERKRMLDERSNYRHKEVMLEAYDRQCDEAAKIFLEYHKRLRYYVNHAGDSKRTNINPHVGTFSSFLTTNEKVTLYSTVKGNKSVDDVIVIETAREKSIREVCEFVAAQMSDKILGSFPAFEGSGIHSNPQLEASNLGFDTDDDLPLDIRDVIIESLKCPSQLLLAITSLSQRQKTYITKEIEKTDINADAEILRYKYEKEIITEASSNDGNSSLCHHLYGNGERGDEAPFGKTRNQLLERQKAHVQQFLATEDALNRASEARNMIQLLLKRLHGSNDSKSSHLLTAVGPSQNMSSLRQLELEVWAKERETAGLRASLNALTTEVLRLNKLCAERKKAENSLRKKWKKIEEFDARRSELELIYNALLGANVDAASIWSQQPLAAREYASSSIIPACNVVVDLSNKAKDLIDNEVSTFYRCPDNNLYMLPATPQALVESMSGSASTGPEAVAVAEKNAAFLTARAGARDPSAIPSVCRIYAALQYPAGLDCLDAGLASVLESLEFCLKLRGSEACVLEDLANAIHLVHVRRDLVENGHALLNHVHHVQQEYDRTANYCLDLAVEHDKRIVEKWLPELRSAVLNAQKYLDDCKYVRGLLDEWWEQPASTVLDWICVDGKNVASWQNQVKQYLAFYDK